MVISSLKDLGEDLGPWTPLFSPLRENSVAHTNYFCANFLPILIGLFNVLNLYYVFLLSDMKS